MPYTKRIEIRWRDMDGFGHVNNAVYLTYLEEARDQFLTELLGHVTDYDEGFRKLAESGDHDALDWIGAMHVGRSWTMA